MFQAFLLQCSHEAPSFVSRALAVKGHRGLAIQRRREVQKRVKKINKETDNITFDRRV